MAGRPKGFPDFDTCSLLGFPNRLLNVESSALPIELRGQTATLQPLDYTQTTHSVNLCKNAWEEPNAGA
jgi:hypothetical protein